ncbi:MAG TPA: anthranilate synthase component I [Planctomycetota bacterium]|nr:anthranilate synthase component I [Planctomycetota bacterium]
MITPTMKDFAALAGKFDYVPVCREFLADALTPVSAFRRWADVSRHAFLLESVEGGEKTGRYSFLGAEPELVFRSTLDSVELTRADGSVERREKVDPLAELEKELGRFRAAPLAGMPRFAGGAVGYVAYDAVRLVEKLPPAPADQLGVSDLYFLFCPTVVAFDNARKTVKLITHVRTAGARNPSQLYAEAVGRLGALAARLERTPAEPLQELGAVPPEGVKFTSNFTQPEYEKVVERCKEYIRAGDIVQVVPSQRLTARCPAAPFDVYRVLRAVNPSPYMFYLKLDGLDVVGSSPEVMVRVEDGLITIRPIAGTRRRGKDPDEDAALAAELLADPKERAEHAMLLDLGRNDVGRVAAYGSVRLDDVMTVEHYSHVMHIVSNVSGRLREGLTAFDALRAGLPAGTVSGAPKVRAMEIINEVEPVKRSIYAGAVGYLDFRGNMDTCIAIRTMVIKDGQAHVQAGGGVVYDSEPAAEFQETMNKARALLAAIAMAGRDLGGR